MNVILTGATGFVGNEMLAQLLEHPRVLHVTAIARRPLDVSHPKLESLVHADFTSYDADVARKLSDHGACIWALGGKMSDFTSEADYEKVTCTFTLALADVFARASSASPRTFCYLSGMGAEPSEQVRLPWEKWTRVLKGRTERKLAELGAIHPGFSAISFRPGGILPKTGDRFAEICFRPWVVRVDVLARKMIDVALDGSPERVVFNRDIVAAKN